MFVSVLCFPIFASVSQYRNCACISDIYQRFFSSKPFVVLSRLTYGAYLAHTMGQLYDQGTLRVPRYLSAYTGVSRPTLTRISFTALNCNIFFAAKYINVYPLLFSSIFAYIQMVLSFCL